MSCKILTGSQQQVARPLQWRQVGEPPVSSVTQPTPPAITAETVRDGGDDHKLHSRIVELERALESEVRQAHDRGFQEGLLAGRQAASAESKPVLERLLQSCTEVAGLRARIRKETEADLVTLTVAIARRVIRRELSVDPEAIHGIVKAALSKIQIKEVNTIRVHPEHATIVRNYFEKAGLNAGLDITADATLPAGGVVFETKRGNLDASVDTQLKEIERGFADRLGR